MTMFNSQILFQVQFKSCSPSFQDPIYLTSMLISPFFSQTTYSEFQFDIKDIAKNEGIQHTLLHLVITDVLKHVKRLPKAETVSLHREGVLV